MQRCVVVVNRFIGFVPAQRDVAQADLRFGIWAAFQLDRLLLRSLCRVDRNFEPRGGLEESNCDSEQVILDVSNNILTGRAITWTSSNQGVATVSSTGLVSAVSVGTAQITATSEGQNGNATLTVTTVPPVPVASVSVSIASSSLNPGQTTQATAVTRDANNNVLTGRSISWISSNSSVATVSGTGLVRAVAAGTAQITATSEGQSGNATLTVVAVPVASVSVSLASSSLDPGQTTQATAVTRDANNNVLTGRSIAWNSSNIAVATVSGAGVVTAVAVGTAQITATSEGQSGSATLTVAVTPPVPVASVTVSLASGSLYPGQTTQASAVTRDANNNVLTGRAITWSSSNQAVDTVSPSGLVTAIAVGAVQILASCVQPAGSSNEPAGMTVISERPFNALNELGCNDANGGGTIVTDATAPKSPSNVLQILLRAGFGEGGGPFAGDYTFSTNYRTIYVSYWAKYSSNWYGPSSNINKTFYLFTSLGAPSIVFDMDAGGNAPMQPVIAGQDILAGGIGGDAANPFWTPNLTTAIAARGQWHHIEFIVVGNTAGNRDGSIDWYLNGVHVGHYTGIQFQSGNTVWNMFHYTLLYTGTNNSNPPADQYNWWDHIYLSGKN